MEPHTIDNNNFDDCQECEPLCLDAIEQILTWVTKGMRNRKLCEAKIAALYVVTNRCTIKESCKRFGVSRVIVSRRLHELGKEFGLRVHRGKLL